MRSMIWVALALCLTLVSLVARGSARAEEPTFASADEARQALKASGELWMAGKLDEAISLREKVVAYDPGLRYRNDSEKMRLLASAGLAVMYARKGNIEAAEHYAVVAQRFVPRSSLMQIVLAWAMRERQRRGLPPRSTLTTTKDAEPPLLTGCCEAGSQASPALSTGCSETPVQVIPTVRDGAGITALRTLSEGLGATVTWDESAQSATATLGDKTITFTLGSVVALANGAAVGLAVAPYLNDEWRMIVPLAPLVEALGGTVTSEQDGEVSGVMPPPPSAEGAGTAPRPSLETALQDSRTLFDQGTAVLIQHLGRNGKSNIYQLAPEDYATARREFIVPMLKALKLLLDNGAPPEDKHPDVPGVSRLAFPYPHDSPAYAALVKKHDEEMEARRKADLLFDAWRWRRGVTYGIVGDYSRPPYATDELRQLATEILKDDAVVKEIMDRVAANIASPQGPIDQP